jgi:hypothetical protein
MGTYGKELEAEARLPLAAKQIRPLAKLELIIYRHLALGPDHSPPPPLEARGANHVLSGRDPSTKEPQAVAPRAQ